MSRAKKKLLAPINTEIRLQQRPARFIETARDSAVACLAMMFLLCASAGAQDASEYQVKAAFLYNFAKFVEWPASVSAGPNAPLVIGDGGGEGLRGGPDLGHRRISWGSHKLQAILRIRPTGIGS